MPHEPLPDLAIGATLPAADQVMKDVSGSSSALKDLAGKNGLLVIFSCNTCPFVIGSEGSAGWEGRYPELAAISARSGVGMALVNSNESKRDDGDSFTDMQHATRKRARRFISIGENHVVADAFGARTTPHVFLFDKNMKLVYKGDRR